MNPFLDQMLCDRRLSACAGRCCRDRSDAPCPKRSASASACRKSGKEAQPENYFDFSRFIFAWRRKSAICQGEEKNMNGPHVRGPAQALWA
jgi:hypothetical protein